MLFRTEQIVNNTQFNYTEHCSVGPTKLIGTIASTTTTASTTTARMKISDEDF